MNIHSIISSIDPPNLDGIRKAWQSDLGIDFTEREWENALGQVQSSSPCARHCLWSILN